VSRGFLRIAATLAREGLAARFSESPHQVQIILILRDFLRDFTRCVKRSRPQATEYPGALKDSELTD